MIMTKTNERNIKSCCNQRLRDRACGVVVAAMTLALAGTPTLAQSWAELAPTGGPPSARNTHSAVYDVTTKRMIVFGGINVNGCVFSGGELNDTYVLENADGLGGTPNWVQLNPTGGPPSRRMFHTAVYDPTSNRMIVFAGNPNHGSCFGTVNDVWVLQNANGLGGTPNWIQLLPTGGPPSSRFTHSAVYDSTANRMIVFAGKQACGPLRLDVWVLEHANGLGGTPNWTQLNPTGGPLARISHSAVYDEVSNRMIVFGGQDDVGVHNDVWVLQNANGLGGLPNWTQLISTGGPPDVRANHSAVYDAVTNRMTVFGGVNFAGVVPASNTTWVLENANGLGGTPNWIQLNPAPDPVSAEPPIERLGHTGVYDPATNSMVIFAGHKGCGLPEPRLLNDVWVLQDVLAPLDSDGDGVNDADDACPDSDLGPTIIINGVDSGVENDLQEDGCTIADLIDDVLADDPSTSEVVHFLVALKKEGLITGKDMGAILKALNSP